MLLASNHMFSSGSIEAVFERLAAAGAGGLDLFLPNIPFLLPAESVHGQNYFQQNLKNCRLAAAAACLPICSIIANSTHDGHGFQSYQSDDVEKGRADALASIQHNVDIATALGATHICGGEGACPAGADETELWQRLARTLKEAAPILERAGITYHLETHPGYLTKDFGKTRWLMKEVNSPNIRICLDFCHANVITNGQPISMIEAINEYIGTVHIADGIQVNSLHLPLGQGEIDVDACIREVKKTGFKGPWVHCMYGSAFPEYCLKQAIKFLNDRHPDILAGGGVSPKSCGPRMMKTYNF